MPSLEQEIPFLEEPDSFKINTTSTQTVAFLGGVLGVAAGYLLTTPDGSPQHPTAFVDNTAPVAKANIAVPATHYSPGAAATILEVGVEAGFGAGIGLGIALATSYAVFKARMSRRYRVNKLIKDSMNGFVEDYNMGLYAPAHHD